MKRILCMLLVLCMVVTMLPMAVFATELNDLGTFEISFEEGAEPSTYTYTAEGNGKISVNIESVSNEATASIELQNVTTNTYGEEENGAYTVEVAENDEVLITVSVDVDEETFVAPAATVVWYGIFTPTAGTEANPIWLSQGENEITVAPGATVYYCGRFGGMILTAKGESGYFKHNDTIYDFTAEGVSVDCIQASMWEPSVFVVTNDSNAEAAYTLTFEYPLGSQMNPELIEELNWYYGNVSQTEGDSDGYYYTYTAPADGTATFYFGFNEGLENYVLDITVANNTSYENKSLLMDGVDNYGMELQVDAKAGDVLVIQVVAVQDAEGNYYPTAEMTWCGNFAYPAGSEQNPIYIEWNWDDAYANATASATVKAGETLYFSGIDGMTLTVDGVETEQNAEGVFSITNSGEEDATYALALATPVGAYSNPLVIDSVFAYSDSRSLDADVSFYYIWTATEDTSIVLDVTDGANVTVDVLTYSEDSEWPISEQFALAEPTVDENWNYTGWTVGEEMRLDVKAGQELKIQVNALTDWSTWSAPAVDYTLSINYAPGTLQSPIFLGELTNTVDNAGTQYYQGMFAGMTVTVTGNDEFAVISEGETIQSVDGVVTLNYPPVMGRPMPNVIGIVGNGVYTIAGAYPVGSMNNPAKAVLGNNAASVAENSQGYFLTYTADYTGDLIMTISGPENWIYNVNNLTAGVYGDFQYSDSDPVVNPTVLPVTAGDEISILVGGYDPDTFGYTPAAEITVNLAYGFEAKIGDVNYNTLENALKDAKSGDVVTLVKNVAADAPVVLPVGVSLNLSDYSLTADYIFGSRESSVIGTPAVGKLIVPKGNIILGKGATNEKGQYVLPIWDPANECYQMSLFVVNTDLKSNGVETGRGLKVDDEKIYFQFKHQASGAFNKSLLGDGTSDNDISIIIRLEWTNAYGVAYQSFYYNDTQVGIVANEPRDYSFSLSGYSALSIDLDTLVVTAMAVTGSGASAYGESWRVDIAD